MTAYQPSLEDLQAPQPTIYQPRPIPYRSTQSPPTYEPTNSDHYQHQDDGFRISRTPSPTPSEAEVLADDSFGGVNWRKLIQFNKRNMSESFHPILTSREILTICSSHLAHHCIDNYRHRVDRGVPNKDSESFGTCRPLGACYSWRVFDPYRHSHRTFVPSALWPGVRRYSVWNGLGSVGRLCYRLHW